MIDRLRRWLARPLTDSDRPRLFVAAAATILVAAGVLTWLHAARERPQQDSPAPAAPATPNAGNAPTVGPPRLPSGERPPTAFSRASRDVVETAKRTARRFLADYLPYTYGHRRARDIRAATLRLRRRLAIQQPRVPPAVRRRRPRVLLVQAEDVSRTRAAVTALVGDNAHRYTVELELTRESSGWTVTNVGA